MSRAISLHSADEVDPGGMTTATDVSISDSVELDWDGPIFDSQIRLGSPQEFSDMCADAGISPTEVLHRLIADLCDIRRADGPREDGLVSNGSDERILAQQYFERCGYPAIG